MSSTPELVTHSCLQTNPMRESWDTMIDRRKNWNGYEYSQVEDYRKHLFSQLYSNAPPTRRSKLNSKHDPFKEVGSVKSFLSYLRGEVAVRSLPIEYEEDIVTLMHINSLIDPSSKQMPSVQSIMKVAISIEREIKRARPFPCSICFLDIHGIPIAMDRLEDS